MNILKLGEKKETVTKRTCKACGTVFEHTESDVKHDNRDGGYYLYCPNEKCKTFILIRPEGGWLSNPFKSTYFDRSTDC